MARSSGFQFLVGCFVIFLAYKVWDIGLIDHWLHPEASEGVDGSIGALAISAAIAAVQWVGYVAILLVNGFQPMAENFVDSIKSKLRGSDKPHRASVDVDELNKVLENIIDRLDAIEEPESQDNG